MTETLQNPVATIQPAPVPENEIPSIDYLERNQQLGRACQNAAAHYLNAYSEKRGAKVAFLDKPIGENPDFSGFALVRIQDGIAQPLGYSTSSAQTIKRYGSEKSRFTQSLEAARVAGGEMKSLFRQAKFSRLPDASSKYETNLATAANALIVMTRLSDENFRIMQKHADTLKNFIELLESTLSELKPQVQQLETKARDYIDPRKLELADYQRQYEQVEKISDNILPASMLLTADEDETDEGAPRKKK